MEDNKDSRERDGVSSPQPKLLRGSEISSYFATPPEPLFNHEKAGLCPELIQKSLQGLAKLNEVSSGQDLDVRKCFITEKSVLYVFLLCHHFSLPADVRYRAVDLFHRFMPKHISELYEHVESTKTSNSPIKWDTVQDRLTHQVSLRATTCVQLASKMSIHYKIVSINKARSFLSSCGFRYACNSLVQSEIRVLKTLDFRVHNPTPLEYVEVLLETLGYNNPSVKVKQLHGICLKVLDVFYLSLISISDRLKPRDSSIHNPITTDLLLVASAIVGAAAFVLDQGSSDSVVSSLSQITRIESDDILDFAAVLIEKIMTN